MDLNEALGELDVVEANIARLEHVWDELIGMVPSGILFSDGSSPEDRRYAQLVRDFVRLANSLPSIDGWRITAIPWGLDTIAQARLDADELGEVEARVSTESQIAAPGREIAEYRDLLDANRRVLVRNRAMEVLGEVDLLLSRHMPAVEEDKPVVDASMWDGLRAAVAELERLIGARVTSIKRWRDLKRHVGWAQAQDFHDIIAFDWPAVRPAVERGLYSPTEPLPVHVTDLAVLVSERPSGRVSTKLEWGRLDAEAFERLLYNILSDADDYDLVQWLMHPNAPDRGRDLSARHQVPNTLGAMLHERVIVQAKHWQTRSIRPTDVAETLVALTLWEPPPVDVLILATTGHFTADAVALIERHNDLRTRPRIEMWPVSHIESLLATRPTLAVEFGLRA